jgi:hypothetical protein
MADISMSGARFLDSPPPPARTIINCNVYSQNVSAIVVAAGKTTYGQSFKFSKTFAQHNKWIIQ